MAKKRKRNKPAAAAAPAPAPAKPRPAGPRPTDPAFWFGLEVSWAKLAIARVVVFGLLALDALLQIRHAPRYGTGFNVAQLPLLDGHGPGRDSYLVAELIQAYLFALAAFGVATRVVVPCAAAIYAWLYFGSQLDSYQHHYLVALVLGIASFIPWARPVDPAKPVQAWALRVLLVQLGIMYLWAAISKLDPAWLDGRALSSQLGSAAIPAERLSIVAKLVEGTIGWAAMAWLVVATELALAGLVWIKRAAFIAAPLGLALHAGIVLTKLEIGLFAWLMIALYTLVVPDRVWVALARLVHPITSRLPRGGSWAAFATIALPALVLAWACRFEHATAVGIVLATVTIAIGLARRGKDLAPVACGYLVALLLWTCVDRFSTVTTDYFRLWGGSARRLGDTNSAERAYRAWIAIDPGDATPHFRLGRVLVEAGHTTDGLAELQEAERLGYGEARALINSVKSGAHAPRPRDDE